ncbi:Uncharacterized protein GBIM_11402, partial [Gryllus bimaculatus]
AAEAAARAAAVAAAEAAVERERGARMAQAGDLAAEAGRQGGGAGAAAGGGGGARRRGGRPPRRHAAPGGAGRWARAWTRSRSGLATENALIAGVLRERQAERAEEAARAPERALDELERDLRGLRARLRDVEEERLRADEARPAGPHQPGRLLWRIDSLEERMRTAQEVDEPLPSPVFYSGPLGFKLRCPIHLLATAACGPAPAVLQVELWLNGLGQWRDRHIIASLRQLPCEWSPLLPKQMLLSATLTLRDQPDHPREYTVKAVRTIFGSRRHLTLVSTHVMDTAIVAELNADGSNAFSSIMNLENPVSRPMIPRSDEDGFYILLESCDENALKRLLLNLEVGTLGRGTPRARMFIHVSLYCDAIAIAQHLWKKDVLEVALLVKQNMLFLYGPFENKLFRVPYHWHYDNVNNFFKHLVRNVHGYPVRVSRFFTPLYSFVNGAWEGSLCFRGRDICVRDTILSHLNATLVEMEPLQPGFGRLLKNGTTTGLTHELFTGRADIAFVQRFLSPETSTLLDYSHFVEVGGFVAIVHRAGEIPEVLKLILAFHGHIWAMLLLSVLLFPLAWTGRGEDLSQSALWSWALLLQQGVNMRDDNIRRRSALAVWAVYSLVMGTAFVASYTVLLASRVRLKDVDTLDDMVRENVVLLLSSGFSDRDFDGRLHGRTKRAQSDGGRFRELLATPGSAAVTSRAVAGWVVRQAAFSSGGEALLHVVRDDLLGFVSAYCARRSWPLLPAASRALRHLQEAGLPRRWLRHVEFRATLRGQMARPASRGPRTLSAAHLQGAVCVLAGGVAAAAAAFAGERLAARWWSRGAPTRRSGWPTGNFHRLGAIPKLKVEAKDLVKTLVIGRAKGEPKDWHIFIPHTALKQQHYVRDDTIFLDITVTTPDPEPPAGTTEAVSAV